MKEETGAFIEKSIVDLLEGIQSREKRLNLDLKLELSAYISEKYITKKLSTKEDFEPSVQA